MALFSLLHPSDRAPLKWLGHIEEKAARLKRTIRQVISFVVLLAKLHRKRPLDPDLCLSGGLAHLLVFFEKKIDGSLKSTPKRSTPENADFRNGRFSAFSGVLHFRVLFALPLSEVSKRGWREGVGATNKPPKRAKNVLQHREKGTEKRPESLAYEGFPRANPLCPPTPFRGAVAPIPAAP